MCKASPLPNVELLVDGKPQGGGQARRSGPGGDLDLGDLLKGSHKLRARGNNAGGQQCQSPEVPVTVGPTVKVLRLIHNPTYPALGGRSLVETIGKRYPGWSEPYKLSEDFNKTLLDASGGFANYVIVKIVDKERWPLRETNGVEATAEQLYNMLANCGPRPGDNAIFPGWANFRRGARVRADGRRPRARVRRHSPHQ